MITTEQERIDKLHAETMLMHAEAAGRIAAETLRLQAETARLQRMPAWLLALAGGAGFLAAALLMGKLMAWTG